MPSYKFHVVLPNGDEYLTETLAEARALEAKHGVHKHVARRTDEARLRERSQPGRPLPNPSQAPPSRKERMKPAMSDGYKHPPQAWAREAIQNSFDAGASRIEFTCGENDCLAIDDGFGMTEEVLLNKLMVPGMSEKPYGAVGGFGEAKKLLTFPWDHFIIATRSMGGKTLVVIGSGEVWDYWRDGKCQTVKYARQRGNIPPHFTEIVPSKPEADFLPYAEAKPIIAMLDKRGHGTAIYIRGTDELHDYMAESGLLRRLGGNKGLPSAPDIISYVVKCELPGKTVVVNGEAFQPDVSIPSNAQRIPARASYPGIDLYLAPPATNDASGATLIRAKTPRGAQLMWTEAGIVPGTLFVEIVGDTKELLTNTRDSFSWRPGEWWEKFKVGLAKDVSSTFRDDQFDEEFLGSGELAKADFDASRERALREAREIQWQYAYKAEQRPTDSKAEKRKQEEEEADKIASRIQEIAKAQPTSQGAEPVHAVQQPPDEIVAEMVKEAVKSEAESAVAGAVQLALWRPPLRLTNQLRDWKPGPEWYPETMGEDQIRLLRAWTEAVRRIHAILSQWDDQFCVGFIFSERTLAYTGWSKTIDARSYCLNPYASAEELRQEALTIPPSMVSLRPDSPDVIPLDPKLPHHLSIVAARAVHECVHGIYGISGHDEWFSSGLTSMVAQIGDKMPSILAAAKTAAKASMPPGFKRRATRVAPTEGSTLSKRTYREKGERDPRLPPPGAVLSRSTPKGYIDVVTTIDNSVWVLDGERRMPPRLYTSLSAVAKEATGTPTNGYLYFDLLDSPSKQSKYRRHDWMGGALREKFLTMVNAYKGRAELNWFLDQL